VLFRSVIAHELAHQWFGDVVTPNGWEDLWLSEGVATFLAARAIDAHNPLFGARLDELARVAAMMDEDTVAVRRAVTTPQQAEQIFTRLPFDKGAAIMLMLERWLGEAVLRTALRAYVRQHAWSSVTTKDLVDALEGASGQSLGEAVGPFLDRPGVPIVDSTTSCEGGRLSSVTVRQNVWAGQRPWTIPVCVGLLDGGAPRCTTVEEVPMRLAFEPRVSCPTWADPNPGLAGYYRYGVRAEQLDAAVSLAPRMSPEAKLGLLNNAWAAVRKNQLHPDAVLRFLAALDGERSPPVLEQEIAILDEIDRKVVRAEDRPAWRRWIAQRFEPLRAAVQNSVAREGDDRRARARSLLLQALGTLAHNDDVLGAASEVTRRWLAGERIDPDIGERAVVIGGTRADAAMVEGLIARAKSGAPEDRQRALEALSRVDTPSLLRRVLTWTLDADGPAEADGYALVRRTSERPEARLLVLDWIKAPGDRMTAKRSMFSPALAALRSACDDAQREPLERLLSVSDGTKLDDVYQHEHKEAIACRDFAAAHGASVAAFLAAAKKAR
jgi:cytosol alanyl aminopeptidase